MGRLLGVKVGGMKILPTNLSHTRKKQNRCGWDVFLYIILYSNYLILFLSMVLTLKLFPDPILHAKCKEVTEVSEETLSRVREMKDTLYSMPGLALAAPQVGFQERIIVLNLMKINKQPEMLILMNPIINNSEGRITMEEGCLSIPEIFEEITRPEKIEIEGMDLDGQKVSMEADDNLARVLQHEIDHLDGILFWDHLSEKKRNKLIDKFLKS